MNQFPDSQSIDLGSSFNFLPTVTKLTQLPEAEKLKHSEYVEFQWDLAGTPTFVLFYTDSQDESFNNPTTDAWDAFLIHEALHHQQEGTWQQRDDELQNVKNYPLEQHHIADIFLEVQTLLDAVSAKNSIERRQAIQYFVAVRKARMASHPIIYGMDGMQERYEGTAHYIEHRLQAIRLNNTLPDITTLLGGGLSEQNNRVSLALGRFYATGAALSMLLDELAIDWKSIMEAGATHYEILEQWLGGNNTDWQALLEQARLMYQYDELLKTAGVVAERIQK